MGTEILITGASGFAGRYITADLRAQGYTVHTWSHTEGNIAARPGDGIAHVIHLAAKTFVPESWQHPGAFYEANVMSTVNVLEFCRKQQAALTLVSSYVYGKPQSLPIGENHPLGAFNPYGQTKLIAEEIALSYQRFHQVPVTIIRPFNIYGAGQDPRFLIPMLVGQALDPAQTEFRVADPRPKRDYLYLSDFAAILRATLAQPAGGIFNAASGVSHSIADIASILNELTGQNKPVTSTSQPRPDDVLDLYADISHAGQALGWRPQYTLRQGLAEMVETARQNAAG